MESRRCVFIQTTEQELVGDGARNLPMRTYSPRTRVMIGNCLERAEVRRELLFGDALTLSNRCHGERKVLQDSLDGVLE